MKHKKPVALILALVLFLLTACGGGQQTPTDTPSASDNTETTSETPAPSGGALMENPDNIPAMQGLSTPGSSKMFGSKTLQRDNVRSVTFLSDTSEAPTENWDVSQAQDGSVIAWTVEKGWHLYDLYIAADGGVIAPENCSSMFAYCVKMESVAFNSAFDTSNITNTAKMFLSCRSLTALDVSGFNTSNVTNMAEMFSECSNLTTLDVSGFDTSHVTNTAGMFFRCENLISLDVSGFNTSHVTDMGYMFLGCQNLTALDVSAFDTSNVKRVCGMFENCPAVTEDVISGWNLPKAKDADGIFNSGGDIVFYD